MLESGLLKRSSGILANEFDGDIVLLSIETNAYFGIEGSGVRMWELLAEPTTVESIGRVIAAEFDVAPEIAREDAIAFCTRLDASGLVERNP